MCATVNDSRLPERFWRKVVVDENGCWKWTGAKSSNGYGRPHHYSGHSVQAHRWAYEALVGTIPKGLQLDHLCRVRSCVNPAHLEPVTPRENTLRGVGFAAKNAAKTHCPVGHEYTGENLYVDPRGQRQCRDCSRIRDRVRDRIRDRREYYRQYRLNKRLSKHINEGN